MPHRHPYRNLRPWRRHSTVLLVSGLVYCAIGWSLIVTDPTPAARKALQFAIHWMSFDQWGYVFLFVGAGAILSARWPWHKDLWGYAILTYLSALWAGFYGIGIVVGDAPATNLRGVLSWGLIAFMWWAISGLVNPGEPPKRPEKRW